MKTSARLALLVTVFAATQSLQASEGSQQQPPMAPQLVHHAAHPLVWAGIWGAFWYVKNPNNVIARNLPESVRNRLGHTRIEKDKHVDAKGLGKLLHVGEQWGDALWTTALVANSINLSAYLADKLTGGKFGTRTASAAMRHCPLTVPLVR